MVEIIAENITNSIEKTVSLLKSGEAVCFPTETVYALACDAFNNLAVKKIYEIKGRDQNKPLSLLVDSINTIEKYCFIDERAKKIINKFSPGPLTYVVKIKPNVGLSENINNNNGTIGFRIPDHKFCLNLLEKIGKPIIATSANISGMESSVNAEQIKNSIGSKIPLIIDGGNSKIGISSTVISLLDDEIKILREGTITLSQIKELFEN